MMKPGSQYALVATTRGYYPNVHGLAVLLNAGDVWKYGETTQLPEDRYSKTYLDGIGLGVEFKEQATGTQGEMKVLEKIKIYNYFFDNLTLPPGNKIFR